MAQRHNRIVVTPRRRERASEIAVGHGPFRVERDGLLEDFHRFGCFALGLQDRAEIVVSDRFRRVEGDGFPEGRDCVVEASLLMCRYGLVEGGDEFLARGPLRRLLWRVLHLIPFVAGHGHIC